jgi:hypothetical protein
MIEKFIVRGNFKMVEVIESTSTMQTNDNPLSDFEELEAFAQFFSDDIPTDPQEIMDNLLSSCEG